MSVIVTVIVGAAVLSLVLVVAFGLLPAPRGRDVPPGSDRPGRIAEAAIARLPEAREEWGRGMRAELAGIAPGRARRRFAAGIVKTVLRTLARHWLRSPVSAVVLAVSAAAILAVHLVLPTAQLFTALTVLLLNGYAAIALTWGARVRAERARARSVLGSAVAAVILAGITAAVVLIVYVVARYPEPARGSGTLAFFSVVTAALVAAYVAFALSPPFAPDACARRWGAVGGAACVLTWAVPAVTGVSGTEDGLSGYSWLAAGLVIPAVVSTIAAARGRSSVTGMQAGLWTALISALAMFTVAVTAVLTIRHDNPADIPDWRRSGAATVTGYLVNDDLGALMLALLFLPLLAVGLGLLGATVGKAMGRDPGDWIDFWIG